jgi:hypothetical protein
MSYTRPSARSLISGLVATMLISSFAAPVVLGKDTAATPQVKNPELVCSPGELPTRWQDDLHPPQTIRVLRTKGPSKGLVQTVDFWTYVSVVMRAEYSTGADKPPLWMRVGAITVKQYGWYKAMFWSGRRTTYTTTDPVTGLTTTTTACYDVKDNTADQIYKPTEQWPDGSLYNGNDPTPPIFKAMRETWHITMRKWVAKKSVTRLFLSGYRSGRQRPCGADATGFKIYQQSLRDCMTKNLTAFETLRRYFEPTYIVNTRDHDVLSDGATWLGDLGVLGSAGGDTAWRLYAGGSDSFAPALTGSFGGVSLDALVGYGAGNVDSASGDPSNGAADPAMLADLVMVTRDNRVLVARANGNGFDSSLVTTSFSGDPVAYAVVGDFNADFLDDVGLVRSTGPGTSSLQVLFAVGDGTFSGPFDWWSGAIDVSPGSFVAAGDVNGDGRADLVARDLTGAYFTAVSAPSCSDFSVWGACPAGAAGAAGLSAAVAAFPAGAIDGAANLAVGDFDRDGRSDVFAVSALNGTIYGLRSNGDGTFASPQTLWSGSPSALAGDVVALNVNPDGMSDLAIVQSDTIGWFQTSERTTGPAFMTIKSPIVDGNINAVYAF